MYGLVAHIRSARGLVAVPTYHGLVKDISTLLGEVDREQAAIAWGVRHEATTVGLTLKFEPFDVRAEHERVTAVADALVAGVVELADAPRIPANFTDAAVLTLARFARRRGSAGVEGLDVAAANGQTYRQAEVSDAVARNAVDAVAPATRDRGSVEGIVDALSGGARNKPSAVVLDALTRQRVRVALLQEHVPLVRDAWGERVAVHGEIAYNRMGQPIRITADEVLVLPQPTPRARLRELVGIAPQWTAGRPVAEVVAEMRGRA